MPPSQPGKSPTPRPGSCSIKYGCFPTRTRTRARSVRTRPWENRLQWALSAAGPGDVPTRSRPCGRRPGHRPVRTLRVAAVRTVNCGLPHDERPAPCKPRQTPDQGFSTRREGARRTWLIFETRSPHQVGHYSDPRAGCVNGSRRRRPQLGRSPARGSAPRRSGLPCCAAHLAMGAKPAWPLTPVRGSYLLRDGPRGPVA